MKEEQGGHGRPKGVHNNHIGGRKSLGNNLSSCEVVAKCRATCWWWWWWWCSPCCQDAYHGMLGDKPICVGDKAFLAGTVSCIPIEPGKSQQHWQAGGLSIFALHEAKTPEACPVKLSRPLVSSPLARHAAVLTPPLQRTYRKQPQHVLSLSEGSTARTTPRRRSVSRRHIHTRTPLHQVCKCLSTGCVPSPDGKGLKGQC